MARHYSVAYEVAMDPGWPDGSSVFCQDTGRSFMLHQGRFELVGPLRIAHLASQVTSLAQMPNIGTSYESVYPLSFAEEHLGLIDFTNVSEIRLVFLWQYSGNGIQQVRWIDSAHPDRVLIESTPFSADQDPGDTGWVALPESFSQARMRLEFQGKSTQSGGLPIAKGYSLYVR